MRTPGTDPLDRERVTIELERRGDHWLAHVSRSPDGLGPLEGDGPEVRGDHVDHVLEAVGLRLADRDLLRRSIAPRPLLDLDTPRPLGWRS